MVLMKYWSHRIDELASILRNKEGVNEIRSLVGYCLQSAHKFSDKAINDLYAVIEDETENLALRSLAIRAFQYESSLPSDVVVTILLMLLDEDDESTDLSRSAVRTLSRQSDLPEDAFLALARNFEAEVQPDQSRRATMTKIWQQLSSRDNATVRLVDSLRMSLVPCRALIQSHIATTPSLP